MINFSFSQKLKERLVEVSYIILLQNKEKNAVVKLEWGKTFCIFCQKNLTEESEKLVKLSQAYTSPLPVSRIQTSMLNLWSLYFVGFFSLNLTYTQNLNELELWQSDVKEVSQFSYEVASAAPMVVIWVSSRFETSVLIRLHIFSIYCCTCIGRVLCKIDTLV